MKFLLIALKVLLLFVSWIIVIGILGKVKYNLTVLNASPEAQATLWMAFPIVLIMAFSFFSKAEIIKIPKIDKFITQIKTTFGIVYIGKVFLFSLFTILTFIAAYLIMMGFHFITLTSIPTSVLLLGSLMLISGIILLVFTNSYFKSK